MSTTAIQSDPWKEWTDKVRYRHPDEVKQAFLDLITSGVSVSADALQKQIRHNFIKDVNQSLKEADERLTTNNTGSKNAAKTTLVDRLRNMAQATVQDVINMIEADFETNPLNRSRCYTREQLKARDMNDPRVTVITEYFRAQGMKVETWGIPSSQLVISWK